MNSKKKFACSNLLKKNDTHIFSEVRVDYMVQGQLWCMLEETHCILEQTHCNKAEHHTGQKMLSLC